LTVTSKLFRLLLKDVEQITKTKLTLFTPDEAKSMYKNTNRIRSTQNKTKVLRLFQGDVYCGERLKMFGISEIDTCIRCFEKETIKQLLMECLCMQDAWGQVGRKVNDVKDALEVNLTKDELEIHADFLSSIVLRKGILPPNTLIKLTFDKYKKAFVRAAK